MNQVLPGFGWNNTLVMTNDSLEVVITLDVGPRIISFRRKDGDNILGTVDDELGGTKETEFKLRGGHRLWLAPENAATYFPDNQTVNWEEIGDDHVRLKAAPETSIQKSLSLQLLEDHMLLTHEIQALEDIDNPVAAWALTILRKGGVAFVPQPMAQAHPGHGDKSNESAYLPDRQLSLWSYTDLMDDRVHWQNPVTIKQRSETGPLKLGFLHQQRHVHYDHEGERFSKTVSYDPDASYPDGNCNLEIYTDGDILELETLSPLTMLSAGESIIHEEKWSITKLS